MSSATRKPGEKGDGWAGSQGLFRAILAGPGHTLADAFASLERAPHVEHILRHPTRDLFSARVSLPPEEGEGYWEFTRVHGEIYVIVANFTYKDPRVELVPGDGLVQFNFKISGDMALAVSRTEPCVGTGRRCWSGRSPTARHQRVDRARAARAVHHRQHAARVPR